MFLGFRPYRPSPKPSTRASRNRCDNISRHTALSYTCVTSISNSAEPSIQLLMQERSASYERALREKSNIIRDTEKRNMNRKERSGCPLQIHLAFLSDDRGPDLQSFRQALVVLQRQVDELDELKARHYEEILEHEEEVWDVVQGKASPSPRPIKCRISQINRGPKDMRRRSLDNGRVRSIHRESVRTPSASISPESHHPRSHTPRPYLRPFARPFALAPTPSSNPCCNPSQTPSTRTGNSRPKTRSSASSRPSPSWPRPPPRQARSARPRRQRPATSSPPARPRGARPPPRSTPTRRPNGPTRPRPRLRPRPPRPRPRRRARPPRPTACTGPRRPRTAGAPSRSCAASSP